MALQFKNRVTKEEISLMPKVSFQGEIVVVSKKEQIESCAKFLSAQPVLGVDTETRPAFTQGVHYPTSLLQISSLKRCYLIQLNKVGLPKPIADIFENPSIIKVGLAFTDDLRGLQRIRPFTPNNCVDIQSIVNQYGILDLGLQKIYAIIFGQRISKTQRLTNWDKSELSDLQQSYAATDAWATLCIYNALKKAIPLSQKEVEELVEADRSQHLLQQQNAETEEHETKE